MKIRSRFAVIAGALLVSGAIVTGVVFAADPVPAAQTPSSNQVAPAAKVAMSQGQKELLGQLAELRKSVSDKLQSDSKALVDQAVADGKVSREEADRLLRPGGKFGRPPGKHGKQMGFGFKFQGLTQAELKAQLDEKVTAGKLTQEQADKALQHWGEHPQKSRGQSR